MMKNKIKKPTEPFGWISFAKDGGATAHRFMLPSEKEKQEAEAFGWFIELLTARYPTITINKTEQLPESGHDFRLETSNGDTIVQLTELVIRDWAKPLSQKEYAKSRFPMYVQMQPDGPYWGVDVKRRDTALKRLIQKKLEKRYSKEKKAVLWLVIFSTGFVPVEFIQQKGKKQGRSLSLAVEYLASQETCVFDQIWFADFSLKSIVQIWPRHGDPLPEVDIDGGWD